MFQAGFDEEICEIGSKVKAIAENRKWNCKNKAHEWERMRLQL